MPAVFSSLKRLSNRFSAQSFPMSTLNGPAERGSHDADPESSIPSSQTRFASMLRNSFQDLKKSAQGVVDAIILGDGEEPYPDNPYGGEEITDDDLRAYLYDSVNFTRFPMPGAADELASSKAPPRYERYLRQSLPPAPHPVSPDLVSDGGSSSASTPLHTPTQTPSPSRLSLRTSTDEYRMSSGYGLGIQTPTICVTPPTIASPVSNRNSRNYLGLKVDVQSDEDSNITSSEQANGMFVIGEDEEDMEDGIVEIDLNDEPVQVMRAHSVRIRA